MNVPCVGFSFFLSFSEFGRLGKAIFGKKNGVGSFSAERLADHPLNGNVHEPLEKTERDCWANANL